MESHALEPSLPNIRKVPTIIQNSFLNQIRVPMRWRACVTFMGLMAGLLTLKLLYLVPHHLPSRMIISVIGADAVSDLCRFLSVLTTACHSMCPTPSRARVIMYDSIAPSGAVDWANELTSLDSTTSANYQFFQVTDGIFLNYWWTPSHLERSRDVALSLSDCNRNTSVKNTGDEATTRCFDVYVGVDVYGRGPNTPGPGKACATAVGHVADMGLSLALFAPGWVLQCGPAKGMAAPEARQHDAEFWSHLELDRISSVKNN